MNNQEIFDIVVAHARKQGEKSTGVARNCTYRNEDGLKCFVGALISDEDYREDMEGYAVNDIMYIYPDILPDDSFDLLVDLQNTHDVGDVLNWEKSFNCLAQKYNLVYTKA